MFLLLGQITGFAQRPKVSWINPKLPDEPGLTHHILDSKAMGHEVGYVVWTPQGYDASGTTRYPVIYFLHGMGGHESADAGGFSSLVARGIRKGHLPQVICVFPNGGRSGYRGDVEKMIIEVLPDTPHNLGLYYQRAGETMARFLGKGLIH